MSRSGQGWRSRLTYANVVTTLALLGAIAGGTAFGLPGKNSVRADDLRKNSVKAIAIAKNAVRSAEIRDGAVGGAEVADGGLAYGDLAQNSVVARIRSSPVAVNQPNPLAVPVTGNTWTQAADETDVFFGQVTFSQSAQCGMGDLIIEVLVDGVFIEGDDWSQTFDLDMAGTRTVRFLTARPFLFEPGQGTARTVTVRAYDNCANAGTSFTIDRVAINAVGMR